MIKMMFAPAGVEKRIMCDDFTHNEDFHTYWTNMCESCRKKYGEILGERVSESGSNAICGVAGCDNESDYYVDFNESEVTVENHSDDFSITSKVLD